MERYNPIKIEKKWRDKWLKEGRWEIDIEKAQKPYYNLMMFPYPSAEGLHVGNLYAFVGSDIHGRYMRMRGYDVFEPIGFDAFGIHSENFALKQNLHPRELIKKSTDNFRRQLERAGNIYSWQHMVNTSEPDYYRWTQWLFLQLYKARLAYKKEAPVEWCPGCKTVLANEQVIAGKCERCDSLVEAKILRQWFFKITEYAERLLKNLDTIDWSERTKIAQRNWIGKSTGYTIQFPLTANYQLPATSSLEVFTTRPDTLFGATYVVVAPEHPLIHMIQAEIENWDAVEDYIMTAKKKSRDERIRDDKTKSGVQLKGIQAINPATKENVPIWVADYVLTEYGTGAIMAVPAHDQRDFEFAKTFHLPVRQVISIDGKQQELERAYEGEGKLVNSGTFSGLTSEDAKEKIDTSVGGTQETHYHLRDWLISRQRYWGPPIPIIYCVACRKTQSKDAEEGIDWSIIDGIEYAIVPVSEKNLLVELPYVENYRPTGTSKSPLATVEEFMQVQCPNCGGPAQRETDVSDTFFDSAWYFLRYPSTEYNDKPFDSRLTKKWLPVDMYIGGQEHAVLHLMYSRFITMFLHDQKILDFEEPFKKFRAHGLLIREGAKMSKSRGNVTNPDEYFDAFGVDTVRVYLMFLSPFEQGGDWHDEGIRGAHRFLSRVWGIAQKLEARSKKQETGDNKIKQQSLSSEQLEREHHKTIKKVTEDIERLHYNTALAALMGYLNALEAGEATEKDLTTLLTLLAPFAPYTTEELWEKIGKKGSVHDQPWPEYDRDKVLEEIVTIPVQINGKVRAQIEVSVTISEQELQEKALEDARVQKYLDGKKPKKVIVVREKIVNIVL